MMKSRLLAMFMMLSTCATARAVDSLAVPRDAADVLNRYCAGCHGETKQKGRVRLDALGAMSDELRLDLLGRVQEQLHFAQMPPEEEKQPTPAQRKLLSDWVRGQVTRLGGSDLRDKLRYPDYGNNVDHDKLFSGEIKDKAFTPARRWLVSPQLFHARVVDAFKLEGRERENFRRGFFGVTNPFVLPEHSGVRDYDNTALDGGHLLVMLTNADWISSKQIWAARVKAGEIKADAFENPKDRWYPKIAQPAFEAIILKKTPPTEAEIAAAVQTQFDCVLQRPADDAELKRYVALTRSAIELAGNTEGLRQMLAAVLLESEFLYRLELGAGETDEYGRRMLSPREASYAIAYALGDRGPDAALIKAAGEGRLNSKEDYKREVTRLLADEDHFRGPIDASLGDKINVHITSHPKIARFFREFFGYTAALKVFKDIPRSGGYYQNPDRGHTGTPGWLINEADELVLWCVDRDQNVFETLLTTDQFFVYHNMDGEAGQKLIAQWKHIYDTLKDTPWKSAPEEVMGKHLEILSAARVIDGRDKELWK
ncbi:MAG: DUF1592 domain-containing protein, partial [Phycisphaeraceae bacterium]